MQVSLLQSYRDQLYHTRRHNYLRTVFHNIRQQHHKTYIKKYNNTNHICNHTDKSEQTINIPSQCSQLRLIKQWIASHIDKQCTNKYERYERIGHQREGHQSDRNRNTMYFEFLQEQQLHQHQIRKVKQNAVEQANQLQLTLCLFVLLFSPQLTYQQPIDTTIILTCLQHLDSDGKLLVYQLLLHHKNWMSFLPQIASYQHKPISSIVSIILYDIPSSWVPQQDSYGVQLRRQVVYKIVQHMNVDQLYLYINNGLFQQLLSIGFIEEAKLCMERDIDLSLKEKLTQIWQSYIKQQQQQQQQQQQHQQW